MVDPMPNGLSDTGERMLPPGEDETSVVFARHHFAYEYASQFVKGKSIIDVGCGTGYGCHLLAREALSVVGIDRDPDAIAYCRNHYSDAKISFIRGDAENLQTNDTYDVCISFQVIEHLHDPTHLLMELRKITNPGGFVLLTTPNSKTGLEGKSDNPFHVSEMSFDQFSEAVSKSFDSSQVFGISYARRHRIREIILRSPLYSLGRMLGRKSRIKKVASGVLQMTTFRLISENIAKEAIDLFAVCRVSPRS
jgi:2-polyprenyl-3-methyl-5-hydroxy-6-metoxy-1,4-benzoquinol methylase